MADNPTGSAPKPLTHDPESYENLYRGKPAFPDAPAPEAIVGVLNGRVYAEILVRSPRPPPVLRIDRFSTPPVPEGVSTGLPPESGY
ncbi:hypothetical protein ACIRRA_38525 [Nocardia sp. NPDC101769]|uniref:hypothetical protein n=1 Tax=Nocardia sp. NPDC101769 TaxID=3364333 RepID=UPI003825870E